MAIKDLKSKRSKFTDNNMLSAATAGELSRAISANENSRVSPDEIKQIKLTNIKIHPVGKRAILGCRATWTRSLPIMRTL